MCKLFRHQAEQASVVCSKKEWVTEGAQDGKERKKALQDKRERGGSYSLKRPGANTRALPDRTEEPKREMDFPATTLHCQ
jgi:hypothetical protein